MRCCFQAQPCFHVLLRYYLKTDMFGEVVKLCRAARLHPSAFFQRDLQFLLHGALEEAHAHKSDEISLAHLSNVLKLISQFPEQLRVIVLVRCPPSLVLFWKLAFDEVADVHRTDCIRRRHVKRSAIDAGFCSGSLVAALICSIKQFCRASFTLR